MSAPADVSGRFHSHRAGSVSVPLDRQVWGRQSDSDSVSIVNLTSKSCADVADAGRARTWFFAGSPPRAYVSCSRANTSGRSTPGQSGSASRGRSGRGRNPGAMAVSPDGSRCMWRFFRIGNGQRFSWWRRGEWIGFPRNVVSDPYRPVQRYKPATERARTHSSATQCEQSAAAPRRLIVKKDAERLDITHELDGVGQRAAGAKSGRAVAGT